MINKAASSEPRVRFRSFFEPDVLTAYGFFKVYQQKGQWGPEERLMFAVLTDAVECFQKHLGAQNRRSRLLFAEAAVDPKQRCKLAVFIRANLPEFEYQPELLANGIDAVALIV